MSKIKQLVLDFLKEIKDLNDLNEGKAFIINVKEDESNKIDFQPAVIEILEKTGSIKILDSFSGIIGISGNELKKWKLKANSHKIIVDSNKFNAFYKEKERELEEEIKCYYKNNQCTIEISDRILIFKKNTGLILYFLYKSRIYKESKNYHDYNNFIDSSDYNNVCDKEIKSDRFNRAVREINERIQKETKGYIKELISIKSLGKNRENEYRWVAKI